MKRVALFLLAFVLSQSMIAAPIPIVFWHSMAGQLGKEVDDLVEGFNQSQQTYRIEAVYKGEYAESLTSFAAAFRAKQPPNMVQVYEVGTRSMLSPKGIIKPVEELTKEQGISLPLEDFLPAVRDFYSESGQLQALPFNVSVPVMYYNAEALEQVGVKAFPKTWDEVGVLAAKLKKSGYDCAYTTAYPSWIHIESFSALHGLSLVDGQNHAVFNNPSLVSHLNRLKEWQKKHYFQYGGRSSDATVLFTSGHCAMFSQSSGSYTSLRALVKFPLAVAPLPMDNSVSDIRHPNIAGGAAIWASKGQSPELYHGIALFYNYLTTPAVQSHWHEKTGYIPIGLSGKYSTFIHNNTMPTLPIALQEFRSLDKQSPPSSAVLFPQNQLRMINDEAMEAIFSGMKSPQEAMNEAVVRADFAIRRFIQNTCMGSCKFVF